MMQPQTTLVPNIDPAENSGDDELAALIPQKKGDKNYALDESVKKIFIEEIYPVIDYCHNNMANIQEKWREILRMKTMEHDSGQRYRGRSNVYIPSYAAARRALISALSQAIFPSDDICDVTDKERPQEMNGKPLPDNDPSFVDAKAVKTYVQWELEKNAKVRTSFKRFLGSMVDYGFAVAKFWYEKETSNALKKRLKKSKVGINTLISEETYDGLCEREGLRFSVRSIYDWYVYPMNINDLEEATLVFEDLLVSRAYVLERERTADWENVDLIISGAVEPTNQVTNRQELSRLQAKNIDSDGQLVGSGIGQQIAVQELWLNMLMPAEAYEDGQDPEVPIPVKLTVAGDVILECRLNPFWHQTHPYLVSRDDPEAGNFFPTGTGARARQIQVLLNDIVNQLNDNGSYAMNPVTKINPGMMAGPVPTMKPGAIFPVTDMNAVQFDRPPSEQLQYGQSMVSMYSSMLADYAGAPPALQGSAAGKSAKTATGMQILQKNANTPLKDIVEDIENDVLSPLMYRCVELGQQFREEKFIAEVAGKPFKMTRAQLAGNYILRWLASSQAANAQQRAQQATGLLQIIQPLVPLIQAGGYVVDVVPLVKRVYVDGCGFRGFDQFISKKTPEQIQQEQMMAAQQGGMPPGGGMPGMPQQQQLPFGGENTVRSAVEQSPVDDGSGSEMQEGEGDELTALRQQIEEETGGQQQ